MLIFMQRYVLCLYGLDNFYYRRLDYEYTEFFISLYGLDNFYYRRFSEDDG